MSDESPCHVSVIVPAHNRGALLRENLDSVLAQSYPAWEAVYADDASTDETPEILAEYAARHPGRIRFVRTTHGGPGLARNAAAQMARGELLLFTDDDVIVPPDWISEMVRLFERAGADALCGGFDPYSLDSPVERYTHFRGQIGFGTTPHYVTVAPMMSFMISNGLFKELGGFSSEFSLINEDWEFCQRMGAHGKSIYYDPSIAVVHRYQTTWEQARRRVELPAYHSVRIRKRQGRSVPGFLLYSLAKFLLSPMWVLRYFPLGLYTTAIGMEARFFAARFRAYRDLRRDGEPPTGAAQRRS